MAVKIEKLFYSHIFSFIAFNLNVHLFEKRMDLKLQV